MNQFVNALLPFWKPFAVLTLTLALPAVCACAVNMGTFVPASADSGKKKNSGLSEFWQEGTKNYNLACEEGSSFERVSPVELKLTVGTLLVESRGDTSLRTPAGFLHVGPRSAVLVRVSSGSERYFCLLESAALELGKRSIPMACGEEVVVFDRSLRPYETTEHGVGVRGVRNLDLDEKYKIASMEFSIVQAMENEPLLNQIVHSRHFHDRFLRSKLLKAAASLNYATNRHGPYFP